MGEVKTIDLRDFLSDVQLDQLDAGLDVEGGLDAIAHACKQVRIDACKQVQIEAGPVELRLPAGRYV